MGLFSSIGNIINDITGATSAAKSGQKYSKRLAAINNAYQKDFAQNSVQWYAQDLEKAGFNRAIAASGGATGASGGGGFDGSASAGGNPIEMISQIIGMQNQTSATKSQNDLNEIHGTAELMNAAANYNLSLSNTDKNKGGILSSTFGTEIGNAIMNDLKKTRIKRNATSAQRTKKNKESSKKLPYFKKLFYFKAE